MRERTPFPRSQLELLPNLKLLITSGMRNPGIDFNAAMDLGITVCGTPCWAPHSGFSLGINSRPSPTNSNGGPVQVVDGKSQLELDFKERPLVLRVLGIWGVAWSQ